MNDNQFTIEPLEDRLEQFRICYWYVGTCSKRILWFTIYYPCWKAACYDIW
jgi:hypothetical protein